ncbi:MAG: CvpA family protein [Hyphomicrobiaceae bacterium]
MIGTFTYLDIAFAALAFISALLAMYRGLTRELLSIVSWIAAGIMALYFFFMQKELATDVAQQMGVQLPIAQVGISVIAFLIVLIVVHIITARISDSILDSPVGMIDSILGFLFGIARAYIIVVVLYMGYTSFFPDEVDQVEWVSKAKTKPYLKSTGESLGNTLVDSFSYFQSLMGDKNAPEEATDPAAEQPS